MNLNKNCGTESLSSLCFSTHELLKAALAASIQLYRTSDLSSGRHGDATACCSGRHGLLQRCQVTWTTAVFRKTHARQRNSLTEKSLCSCWDSSECLPLHGMIDQKQRQHLVFYLWLSENGESGSKQLEPAGSVQTAIILKEDQTADPRSSSVQRHDCCSNNYISLCLFESDEEIETSTKTHSSRLIPSH